MDRSQTPARNHPQDQLAVPRLLLERPGRLRAFLGNLGCVLLPATRRTLYFSANPGEFWPDVFVNPRVPRWRFVQSAMVHVAVGLTAFGVSHIAARRVALVPVKLVTEKSITYYEVSEYLPQVNAAAKPATPRTAAPRPPDPAYAKQEILSLAPNPDNLHQTIVAPSPKLLRQLTAVPNIVAWTPLLPAAPVEGLQTQRAMLTVPTDVIAPAAALPEGTASRRRLPRIPEPSIIEPPASPQALQRPIGDISLAHLAPSVEAPRLAVPEQRAGMEAIDGGGAPAPLNAQEVAGSIGPGGGTRLIALSLQPAAPSGPIAIPEGSRQGEFAAGPQGRPGGSGAPHLSNGNGAPGGSADGPPGILVGTPPPGALTAPVAGPQPSTPSRRDAERLLASVTPPKPTDLGRLPNSPSGGKIEDKVFAGKKYYTMHLNMPNLTSAGGSWIIRFAELHADQVAGEVTAPVATLKVDPKYPADLMRNRIEGTVILYAVIQPDGTVAQVRVLESVEQHLDENAVVALSRWKFRPGTKNGAAVPLEAVVQIPFRAVRPTF